MTYLSQYFNSSGRQSFTDYQQEYILRTVVCRIPTEIFKRTVVGRPSSGIHYENSRLQTIIWNELREQSFTEYQQEYIMRTIVCRPSSGIH